MDPFYFYRYTWSRCPDNKQLLNRKLAHFKQLWRGKAIQSTVSWHTTLTVYVHTHRWSVTLPSINHSSMKHYCRKQKQHKNTLSSHMATSATLKAKNNLHGFVPVTRRADKKKTKLMQGSSRRVSWKTTPLQVTPRKRTNALENDAWKTIFPFEMVPSF